MTVHNGEWCPYCNGMPCSRFVAAHAAQLREARDAALEEAAALCKRHADAWNNAAEAEPQHSEMSRHEHDMAQAKVFSADVLESEIRALKSKPADVLAGGGG